MICSIYSLLMILAFILVLMKDIKIDSGWISAIAAVASFSLSWRISVNGNKQREADKRIEEDRLLQQELKELLKIYVRPWIAKFLTVKIDKQAFLDGRFKDEFFENLRDLLEEIRINIRNLGMYINDENKKLLDLFDDVIELLYYMENVCVDSMKELCVSTINKKCLYQGFRVLDATNRTLSRLELILLFNNIKAFKREVDSFKEKADKLNQCLKEHPNEFSIFPFPVDKFKTIKY